MKVISSHDNGSLHFGRDDNSLKDFASDGYVAGEGALLIDIGWLDGLLGGSEAEANVLEVSDAGRCFFGEQLLAVQEDSLLLLEWSLVLRI